MYFFFSSRRRHTRWTGDWSSDVCSSDLFVEARLAGWSASIGHQLDVGGKTPGGNGCDATEIFQEGLRIPPLRLYAAGKPVDAVFELIDRNVRVPRQVLGDVRSQVAACLTGERGYLALADQYGADRFA